MIYGAAAQFVAALERIKRRQRLRQRLTRKAKQRARAGLRKLRAC